MVNEIAHWADGFEIRLQIIVWVAVDVMDDLPFLSAKSAVLAGEIVSL
jgi:hypothetical protein